MNPSQPDVIAMLLPLDSELAVLARAGGKGANLARLARAGFPVPGGFIISVEAYEECVGQAGILPSIQAALAGGRLDDPDDLERVSDQVRALFTVEMLPPELAESIAARYAALGAPAVGVRSSATAEDLPEMSFAGQQDTYLNVHGEQALLKAVVACWASLWTARAIGYRHRQGVGQDEISLAVVVQQMVQSESSGVLFTANPLSGLRSETVIDATLGLGEALVSGQVEPDRYRVDTAAGRIVEKKLGAKALSIRGQSGGGVETVHADASAVQALPDEQILALARLGRQAAELFGGPQDVEWAWADGKLFLLQSRPVTSLYPVPASTGPDDLRTLFSFGSVQGMLDPMTPLGRDMIRLVLGGGSALFDGKGMDETTQHFIHEAGERLWLDTTKLIRNPVGRKAAQGALGYIDVSILNNAMQVWDDPRLMPTDRRLRPQTAFKLARFAVPMAGRVVQNWARPEARMVYFRRMVEDRLAAFQAECQAVSGSRGEKLAQRLALLRSLGKTGTFLAQTLISALMASMSQFALLRSIGGQLDRQLQTGNKYTLLSLEITRGIPFNVTTEMDLALWETAQAIRADAASLAVFKERSSSDLAEEYQARRLPAAATAALDRFLSQYGLRGVGEIDLGRVRWVEEPTHVMEVLGSYLQIEDPELAPDTVFARGARNGQAAASELAEAARKLPHGWLKSRQVRFAARRVRAMLGSREAPKFYAIRVSGLVRLSLMDSGREYVAAGELKQADDVFYLTMKELAAFAAGQPGEWQALIDARRAAGEREKRRRQIPRLLLSDGRAFYEGMSASSQPGDGTLRGDPVSPGLVEGLVRVVLDPRGAKLAPGEILVCPGTDPAWTPLFLAAGGLVMEVGGLMTHGAVVAREYGIPAVVSVDRVTQRLKTGQRIRVNGSTGEIEIL